jgi:hypothetical protein
MQIIENLQHYPMGVVGTLLFLGFGVYVTVRARRVQQYAIQWHECHPELARFNLFRQRIYRPAYLFELRVCGMVSFLAGVLLCWVMFVGK